MKKKILLSMLAFVFAFSCIAFAGCGKTPNQYNISVKASHYNLGSVEGGNSTYIEGETITIKATPAMSTSNNETPEFICWLLNNKVISTKAEYQFEVNAETAGEYIALFTCEYLEYFALNQIIVDTAVTTDSNANVIKLSLELGSIENLTQEVCSIEPTSTEQVLTLTSTDIYAMGANPHTFDMQEDIFVKFTLIYEQDGVQFESVTTTKIPATYDVTQEVVSLATTNLNTATNPENPDIVMSLANVATLSLNFSRLTNFELTEPETKE